VWWQREGKGWRSTTFHRLRRGSVKSIQHGQRQGSRKVIVRDGGASCFEEYQRNTESCERQEVLEGASSTSWRFSKWKQGLWFSHALPALIPQRIEPAAGDRVQPTAQHKRGEEEDGTSGRDAGNTTHENLHGRGIPNKTIGRGPLHLGTGFEEEAKLDGSCKPCKKSKQLASE
jgi:hypothetical protein